MEGGLGSAGPALLREMGHRGAGTSQQVPRGAGSDRPGPALPTPRGPWGLASLQPRGLRQAGQVGTAPPSPLNILLPGRPARTAQFFTRPQVAGHRAPATLTRPLGAGGSGKAMLLGHTEEKMTRVLGSCLTPTLDGTGSRRPSRPSLAGTCGRGGLSKPAEGWGQQQAGDSAKGTRPKSQSAVAGGGGQGLCEQSWTRCQAGRGDISHHSAAESRGPAA